MLISYVLRLATCADRVAAQELSPFALRVSIAIVINAAFKKQLVFSTKCYYCEWVRHESVFAQYCSSKLKPRNHVHYFSLLTLLILLLTFRIITKFIILAKYVHLYNFIEFFFLHLLLYFVPHLNLNAENCQEQWESSPLVYIHKRSRAFSNSILFFLPSSFICLAPQSYSYPINT